MNDIRYSASVMCANLGRLEEQFKTLEAAGCHELHFDIMDGHFVPNLTLGPDFIRMARDCCGLPCSAHLMLANPDPYIERLVRAGCASVTVHVEACVHAHRSLAQIRQAGAAPGIAINPATPLTKLDYLLDYVDRILVMTVDPGYAGQPIIGSAYERVAILKQNLAHRRLQAHIEVDGNISLKNAAALIHQGARILVLGTASIFGGRDPGEAFHTFKETLALERKLV